MALASYPILFTISVWNIYSEYHHLDASENRLQILFSEQMEIGQTLHLKLFFSSGSELNTLEMLAEVVWINGQSGESENQCRSGVRFINVSPEGMNKLKTFLAILS
jgi:hypothetical protein